MRPQATVRRYFAFSVRGTMNNPNFGFRKSNCNAYAYIVKHNYVLGGMLFTIRKAQLRVSATKFGHHQVVQ